MHLGRREPGRRAKILRRSSVIIRFLASKSLSFMLFGVPGLNRILTSMAVLVTACAIIISCGSNSSSSAGKPSRLRFRAFVSNPLLPIGGANSPVLNVVDALQDQLSLSVISLQGNSTQPGLMALSPNKVVTAVYSAAGNSVVVVNNVNEAIATAAGSTSPLPVMTLPGFTESLFIDQVQHNCLRSSSLPPRSPDKVQAQWK